MIHRAQRNRNTSSAITHSSTLQSQANITNRPPTARGKKYLSAHQEPNKKTTNTDTFAELNPSQPIGIELKCSHHQIQHFLMLTHHKRAVSRIELLNPLELDFTELCHLPRANEASVNPIKSSRWSTEPKIQNLLRYTTEDHSNHWQIIPKQDEMNNQKNRWAEACQFRSIQKHLQPKRGKSNTKTSATKG